MAQHNGSREIPETLQALVRDLASAGDREALVTFDGDEPRGRSFRDLASAVETRARALSDKGVRAGDPVVLCGPADADWIMAFLALLRCGACAVPVDAQFAEDTFRHVLEDSGAKIVLAADSSAKRFGRTCAEAGAEILPLATVGSAAEGHDTFAEVEPGDRAVLFYTSGTTGPPKGVPLTHRNIAYQLSVIADTGLVTPDDRVLLPLPLHHVYPLVIGTLVPLSLRLSIVLPDGFTGTRVMAALRGGNATLMVGVPRLYEALVTGLEDRLRRKGRVAAAAFGLLLGLARVLRRRFGLSAGKVLFAPLHRRLGPALRTVVSGGAALKPELAWTLEALGWQVGAGYGLTETSPLLTINPPGAARFETAGRPVPGVELRIDRSAGDGGPDGEVLARGPGVFAEYHGLPDKTGEAFTEDGWYRTGDLGHLDEDGWLHLAGRASTLIVTEGGENVQPEEIEDAYQAHPAIAEIAVFERDGGIAGLIVPDPALRRRGEADEAVREAVREISRSLPSYQRLAEYRLTGEAIPRTRLGKPRRHLIEDRFGRAGKKMEEAGGPVAEPVSLDELSGEDRALLENDAASAAFALLTERFADRRVTPDSDLQLDLGIDSIDWLDLTFDLSERTGIALSEETVAGMQSVRDLLTGLAHGSADDAARRAPLEDPEAALDEAQRRWLEPPGPALRLFGRVLAAVNRAVMRGLFRVEHNGTENLPADGPFVMAPNHASYLDPFALGAGLELSRLERLCWAGWKGVVFSGPVRRTVARAARAVPIDPLRATGSSLAFGGAALQRGLGLVWFPEGERSQDGRLHRFRPGIGLLLDRWRVPVVPVIVRGTHAAWPPSRRWPRFRPIRVDFLPPLDVSALAGEGEGETDAARIVDALYRRIADALGES